jgi:hypothetical protein
VRNIRTATWLKIKKSLLQSKHIPFALKDLKLIKSSVIDTEGYKVIYKKLDKEDIKEKKL